jgi:hypothetical protein
MHLGQCISNVDWMQVFWWVLTIMPTVPRASNSVALLPLFLRIRDRSNSSDDLMAGYDWETVAKKSFLYCCV